MIHLRVGIIVACLNFVLSAYKSILINIHWHLDDFRKLSYLLIFMIMQSLELLTDPSTVINSFQAG